MTAPSHDTHLRNLKRLNRQIQTIVDNAHSMDATGSGTDPWESAFDLVFSETISRHVRAELDRMNQELSYYDPDSSCEEDVRAYATAVNAKVEELDQLLRGPEPDM